MDGLRNSKKLSQNERSFYLFLLCYTARMAASAKALSKSPAPRRQARGLRTRETILERAVDISSVHGLDGLTVGHLADALHMSKSGLFAHFGSKEELQLATIDTARRIFIERVVRPALAAPKGMPRLWKLIHLWISYVEKRVFSGGCFFTAASFEFDSRRGPVRDRIALVMREWMDVLTRAVQEAQRAGHIAAKIDATSLAHELHAIAIGAHWAEQLLDDRRAYARSLTITRKMLARVATPKSPALP
jgi:AcrR family transcriptional regulator